MLNWKSTKFLLAAFIQVISAVALFMRIIDGQVWVFISSLTLGIYGAANVTAQHIGNLNEARRTQVLQDGGTHDKGEDR